MEAKLNLYGEGQASLSGMLQPHMFKLFSLPRHTPIPQILEDCRLYRLTIPSLNSRLLLSVQVSDRTVTWMWEGRVAQILCYLLKVKVLVPFLLSVCVDNNVSWCTCVYTCMWRPRLTWGVILIYYLFLRQILLVNLEFIHSARLTVKQTPEILQCLPPECWDYRYRLWTKL